MLKRREKPKLSFRIRQLFWPQMGIKRLIKYLTLRIVRLAHAPEPLARAIACGMAVTFFPVFGVHAILAVTLAFITRANILASVVTTIIMPAVILPLIFSLDFLVGRKILRYFGFFGQGSEADFMQSALKNTETWIDHFDVMFEHFKDFFLPAFTGSFIFMLLVWPATYMAAHKLIEVIEHRHRNRIRKRKARL